MFDPKLLVGSAVLAALLSGCGGSSSSSDDAGTPPSGGDDGVALADAISARLLFAVRSDR